MPPKNQAHSDPAAEAIKHIVFGALWAIGGTVVTVGTFLSARQGDHFIIAYGAIIGGVIEFFIGLAGLIGGGSSQSQPQPRKRPLDVIQPPKTPVPAADPDPDTECPPELLIEQGILGASAEEVRQKFAEAAAPAASADAPALDSRPVLRVRRPREPEQGDRPTADAPPVETVPFPPPIQEPPDLPAVLPFDGKEALDVGDKPPVLPAETAVQAEAPPVYELESCSPEPIPDDTLPDQRSATPSAEAEPQLETVPEDADAVAPPSEEPALSATPAEEPGEEETDAVASEAPAKRATFRPEINGRFAVLRAGLAIGVPDTLYVLDRMTQQNLTLLPLRTEEGGDKRAIIEEHVQALSALDHPNVISWCGLYAVSDSGETVGIEEGDQLLALEPCDRMVPWTDPALLRRLKGGGLGGVSRLAIKLASAVDCASEAGLLPGKLTPKMVFVAPGNEPKLLLDPQGVLPGIAGAGTPVGDGAMAEAPVESLSKMLYGALTGELPPLTREGLMQGTSESPEEDEMEHALLPARTQRVFVKAFFGTADERYNSCMEFASELSLSQQADLADYLSEESQQLLDAQGLDRHAKLAIIEGAFRLQGRDVSVREDPNPAALPDEVVGHSLAAYHHCRGLESRGRLWEIVLRAAAAVLVLACLWFGTHTATVPAKVWQTGEPGSPECTMVLGDRVQKGRMPSGSLTSIRPGFRKRLVVFVKIHPSGQSHQLTCRIMDAEGRDLARHNMTYRQSRGFSYIYFPVPRIAEPGQLRVALGIDGAKEVEQVIELKKRRIASPATLLALGALAIFWFGPMLLWKLVSRRIEAASAPAAVPALA